MDPDTTATSGRRDPLLGAVINGKFLIHRAIARGGMGRIYYATQQPLDRPVALKVVQGDGDQEHESQFLKRFLQEASILAKLQHPNVVTLYDYGRIEGTPIEQYFIAMEYLDGETLTERLATRHALTLRDVLVLARQMARGLREAHARGIVHRDLKPSNVILVAERDGGELVKIVDFGIGKVMERSGDAQDLTQDGFLVGTPRFMAPEQFDGTASPASDFYALGMILFLCTTGRLPFGGSNMAEIMVAKISQPIPPMREVAPLLDVPESFESLVRWLLARRPEDRPTTEQLFAQLGVAEDEIFGPGRVGRSGQAVPTLVAPSSPGVAPSDPWGRTPAPGASGASGERLRVPRTVVASMASLTPRPTEAAAEAPRRSRAPLVAVAVAALLVAAGVVTYVAIGRLRARAEEATHAAVTASTSSAETPPPAFTLVIESAPTGATVYEGEAPLGATPLQLTVDRAATLARPRTFVLKKEGYLDATLVQGPASETVRSLVTLAPDAQAPVKSKVTKGGSAPASARPGAPPAPTGLDIRIKR